MLNDDGQSGTGLIILGILFIILFLLSLSYLLASALLGNFELPVKAVVSNFTTS